MRKDKNYNTLHYFQLMLSIQVINDDAIIIRITYLYL